MSPDLTASSTSVVVEETHASSSSDLQHFLTYDEKGREIHFMAAVAPDDSVDRDAVAAADNAASVVVGGAATAALPDAAEVMQPVVGGGLYQQRVVEGIPSMAQVGSLET